MYLVDVKTPTGLINTIRCEIDELQELNPANIKNIYLLQPIDLSILTSTQEIRTAIYKYLKGKQELKKDVIDHVASSLNIKKTEVSKVITQMQKEKIIYIVPEMGWLGID